MTLRVPERVDKQVKIFYENDPYLKTYCLTKKKITKFLQGKKKLNEVKTTLQITLRKETRRYTKKKVQT